MKIRIKGNSVRFRLSKPELGFLAKHGYLEEKTEFATNTFCYAIQRLFDGKTLDASFTGNKLTMFVPNQMVEDWVNTDVVGFSNHLSVDENKTLSLLIEKDFKCTDNEVSEDQSDYFDHPEKNC